MHKKTECVDSYYFLMMQCSWYVFVCFETKQDVLLLLKAAWFDAKLLTRTIGNQLFQLACILVRLYMVDCVYGRQSHV